MINVNKITATLAKMPDVQLQQYAQMHKADPYIMALAMSESNRRKELRAASQAPAQMEQPKVVDQMVAEMAPQQLPEEMGIGRLNAGNMNFAGGGIIAFADGGGVERYAPGGSTQIEQILRKPPFQRTPEDNALLESAGYRLQRSVIPPDSAVRAADTALTNVGPSLRNTFTAGANQLTDEQLAQMPAAGGALNEKILRGLGSSPAATAPAVAQAAPTNSTATMAARASASPYGTSVLPAADPAASPRAMLNQADQTARSNFDVYGGKAAPTADTTRKAPTAGLGAAAAVKAVPEQSAADRYLQLQKDMGLGPESRADVDKKRSELEASKRAQAKSDLEDFEKDVAARGEAFKGREERLAKREAGLGKMKDETTGLALMEVGLGIMSTPGGLATAIGKGAQPGLKTYGAGLEKLRLAQEKLDDARDQIEEFRRNEANMTAKERRQYKSNIARTETEIKQLGVEAAEKMYGYKREDAKSVFAASTQERLTKQEIDAKKDIAAMQERGANARAGALPSEARIAMLLGTGTTDAERFATGMAKYKELTGDKQGTQMLKLFLEENGRREKNMEQPLTLEQFRRTSAAFFAPPAAVDTGKPTRP